MSPSLQVVLFISCLLILGSLTFFPSSQTFTTAVSEICWIHPDKREQFHPVFVVQDKFNLFPKNDDDDDEI